MKRKANIKKEPKSYAEFGKFYEFPSKRSSDHPIEKRVFQNKTPSE